METHHQEQVLLLGSQSGRLPSSGKEVNQLIFCSYTPLDFKDRVKRDVTLDHYNSTFLA